MESSNEDFSGTVDSFADLANGLEAPKNFTSFVKYVPSFCFIELSLTATSLLGSVFSL